MNHLDQIIKLALEEDIGPGDITSQATVAADLSAFAEIRAKEQLVLAGSEAAQCVFAAVDAKISWKPLHKDGDQLSAGDVIAKITGNARSLLAAERTALNFLQHLSGIATMTCRFVDAVSGTHAKILDTRKTMPGLRELEKAAVKAGGGENHRMGLFDHILIKNNHITAVGSVTKALKLVKAARKKGQKIEVETRTTNEIREAVEGNADIIMLDNMSVNAVIAAVKFVSGRALLEVSGNITLENIRTYAETGVDFISVGSITHSAPAADINMLIAIQN